MPGGPAVQEHGHRGGGIAANTSGRDAAKRQEARAAVGAGEWSAAALQARLLLQRPLALQGSAPATTGPSSVPWALGEVARLLEEGEQPRATQTSSARHQPLPFTSCHSGTCDAGLQTTPNNCSYSSRNNNNNNNRHASKLPVTTLGDPLRSSAPEAMTSHCQMAVLSTTYQWHVAHHMAEMSGMEAAQCLHMAASMLVGSSEATEQLLGSCCPLEVLGSGVQGKVVQLPTPWGYTYATKVQPLRRSDVLMNMGRAAAAEAAFAALSASNMLPHAPGEEHVVRYHGVSLCPTQNLLGLGDGGDGMQEGYAAAPYHRVAASQLTLVLHMECATAGSLHTYMTSTQAPWVHQQASAERALLARHEFGSFVVDLRQALSIGAQVVAGLSYLHHSCNFLHGDIKPSNILLSRRNGTRLLHAMIADLGGGTTFGPTGVVDACRTLRTPAYERPAPGTPASALLQPRHHRGDGNNHNNHNGAAPRTHRHLADDTWAAGILLGQMLVGGSTFLRIAAASGSATTPCLLSLLGACSTFDEAWPFIMPPCAASSPLPSATGPGPLFPSSDALQPTTLTAILAAPSLQAFFDAVCTRLPELRLPLADADVLLLTALYAFQLQGRTVARTSALLLYLAARAMFGGLDSTQLAVLWSAHGADVVRDSRQRNSQRHCSVTSMSASSVVSPDTSLLAVVPACLAPPVGEALMERVVQQVAELPWSQVAELLSLAQPGFPWQRVEAVRRRLYGHAAFPTAHTMPTAAPAPLSPRAATAAPKRSSSSSLPAHPPCLARNNAAATAASPDPFPLQAPSRYQDDQFIYNGGNSNNTMQQQQHAQQVQQQGPARLRQSSFGGATVDALKWPDQDASSMGSDLMPGKPRRLVLKGCGCPDCQLAELQLAGLCLNNMMTTGGTSTAAGTLGNPSPVPLLVKRQGSGAVQDADASNCRNSGTNGGCGGNGGVDKDSAYMRSVQQRGYRSHAAEGDSCRWDWQLTPPSDVGGRKSSGGKAANGSSSTLPSGALPATGSSLARVSSGGSGPSSSQRSTMMATIMLKLSDHLHGGGSGNHHNHHNHTGKSGDRASGGGAPAPSSPGSNRSSAAMRHVHGDAVEAGGESEAVGRAGLWGGLRKLMCMGSATVTQQQQKQQRYLEQRCGAVSVVRPCTIREDCSHNGSVLASA